jgi:CubicO group peptidase (beta-lactamase class C family)
MFQSVDPNGAGCSAAVQKGDELAFAAGYGRLVDPRKVDETDVDTPEQSAPINRATRFDIASTSKQFTGLAVEMLIADGAISRNDRVGDLLVASLPATEDVTVQQLLNHTSGLTDYGDLLDQEDDEFVSQAETIEAIAASTPGEPGRFDYSNSNYVLLASIVEKVTGEPFARFVHDEIFAPLDLEMEVRPTAMADPDAAMADNIAVGEEWPVAWAQYGDGAVLATPSELVRWSSQFWDQTLDGPQLRELGKQHSVDADEGDRYGSGVMFGTLEDGTEVIHHSGSWGGTVTDWVVSPEDEVAVAVMCNAEDAVEADSPAFDILEAWSKAGA